MSRRSELDIIPVTVEKLYPQFIFQLPDPDTDSSLGNKKIFGRIAKVACPVNFQKCLENIDIHF